MSDPIDLAAHLGRQELIHRSLTAKAATRPPVDANGHPVDPDAARPLYDGHGRVVSMSDGTTPPKSGAEQLADAIRKAKASGDTELVAALERQRR